MPCVQVPFYTDTHLPSNSDTQIESFPLVLSFSYFSCKTNFNTKVHVCRSEYSFGNCSFLALCGMQGLSWDGQSWLQAPLPAEPSHWPSGCPFLSHKNFIEDIPMPFCCKLVIYHKVPHHYGWWGRCHMFPAPKVSWVRFRVAETHDCFRVIDEILRQMAKPSRENRVLLDFFQVKVLFWPVVLHEEIQITVHTMRRKLVYTSF